MNKTAGGRGSTRLGRLIPIAFLLCASSPGQTPGVAYFETKIRPLFASKCQGCHSAAARIAGLDLSSAAGFQKGAASGTLVSVSDPSESRLLRAVGYEGAIKMPPSGKLKEDEIAALREWVRSGSTWPAETPKPLSDSNGQSQFWSFQPVRKPAPPEVRNKVWVRSPIDAFILAKLEEKHLQPAPPADKLTLLRRATYDLTGLPPTEAEIRAFLDDHSPEAFARVVDRLIESPRYGERWGRHWMDVARYADSTGADEDHRYPYAWRYRDYVIEAFNRDEPYHQFMREQIAGDLLPADNGDEVNVRGIVATGFLALGPKLIAEQDKKKMLYDMVDEEIDVASRAFLGLTIACARCHDHKFDPISTKDYYGLASILVSSKQLAKIEGTVSELYFAPLVPKDVAGRYEAQQARIKEKQKEIDELLAEEGARYRDSFAPRLADYMLAAWRVYQEGAAAPEAAAERKLDAGIVEKWAAYLKPVEERRAHLELWYRAEAASREAVAGEYQKRFMATAALRREAMAKWKQESLAAKASGKEAPPEPKFPAGADRFFTEVASGKGPFALPEKDRDKAISENGRARLAALEGDLKNLETSGPPEPPLACALSEGTVIDQKVFIRGNPENLGEAAPKRFPLILASNQAPIAKGSGRRELADWLASAANPLPARVMANRIWEWHFGEGIVRTPSNFGKMGERPTHPELLDYLAARFVEGGWSVKSMHRMLMLSSAYQMSSAPSPEALAQDADDSLLSRFPQRRLEVEEIRDSLLALDGSLDLTMGGAMQTGHGTDKEFSDERMSLNPDQSKRRTVYLPLRRSNLPSLLTLFDFGDATSPGEGRSQTNVAPQALYMMNSEFVARQAGSLAKQLLSDAALDDAGRIRQAYYRAQSRPPRDEEVRSALEYIRHFPGKRDIPEQDRLLAWTSFCRTLVASNDFLYVH
jgi:hypothetical protein